MISNTKSLKLTGILSNFKVSSNFKVPTVFLIYSPCGPKPAKPHTVGLTTLFVKL